MAITIIEFRAVPSFYLALRGIFAFDGKFQPGALAHERCRPRPATAGSIAIGKQPAADRWIGHSTNRKSVGVSTNS